MSEWLAGKNPVTEALKANRPIDKLLVAKGVKPASVAPILQLAKRRGIVVQYVKRHKLDHVTGGVPHQGVVAMAAPRHYSDLAEVLNLAQKRGDLPLLLVLDGIEDPHNLGSIIRTADAAGVHGVIIPKRRAVGLTPTVAKTSAGAVEYVPVVRVTNLVHTLKELKQEGFWVTGAEAAGDRSYTEVDFTEPTVIVIGSEGKGISRLVRENCDYVVRLPMRGTVNSLNASVAAGIMLYEVMRQRTV